MLTRGSKAAIWMGSICLLLFIGKLAFRAFIYNDMYIAPDDPYGISDIIELYLFVMLLLLFIISALLSLTLFIKGKAQSKKSALLLTLLCVVLYFSNSPLRDYAAELSR